MSYRLYRNTTLGHTLQEALDELMQMQMLSANLAIRVLLQVSFLCRKLNPSRQKLLGRPMFRHFLKFHFIAQSSLPFTV